LKREVSYIALGLTLAVIVTVAYYQVAFYTAAPIAGQILRETTDKAEVGLLKTQTFTPVLAVTVLVAAFSCACLTYGVVRRKLS